MVAQPATTAAFRALVSKLGWAGVQAQGIVDPATKSNNPSVVQLTGGQYDPKAIGQNASAYDPSGTNTMGGGLGTASGAAGDNYRNQLAQQSAAANGYTLDNNNIITGFKDSGGGITVPDAQADAAYQRQVSALAMALSQYQNQINLQNQQYQTNFSNRLQDMGYIGNNPSLMAADGGAAWNTAKGSGSFADDFNANQGDFAGRGVYRSGVYQQAVGDLQNNYNQQKSRMDTAQQQYLDTNNAALQAYTQQNQAAQQAALGDAVARIALQYGINANQVPGQ